MGFLLLLVLLGVALLVAWGLTRWQATVTNDLGRSLVLLGISGITLVLLVGLYILTAWPPLPWGS